MGKSRNPGRTRVAARMAGQILHFSNNRLSLGAPRNDLWSFGANLRGKNADHLRRFGIVIRMYHDEHPPPRFHAAYQGFDALVAIADGEIIRGSLPRKAARLVRQWALDHKDELMANWTHGENLEPMEMVPGADADD